MGPRVPPAHALAFTRDARASRDRRFPLGRSIDQGWRRADARRRHRARLDGDVAETWLGLEAMRKTIRIVEQRQVLPACLSVDTAASGFQAGTTDLAAVLDAECRFRAVKFELLKLKVEEQARYAELERLAGGPL